MPSTARPDPTHSKTKVFLPTEDEHDHDAVKDRNLYRKYLSRTVEDVASKLNLSVQCSSNINYMCITSFSLIVSKFVGV